MEERGVPEKDVTEMQQRWKSSRCFTGENPAGGEKKLSTGFVPIFWTNDQMPKGCATNESHGSVRPAPWIPAPTIATLRFWFAASMLAASRFPGHSAGRHFFGASLPLYKPFGLAYDLYQRSDGRPSYDPDPKLPACQMNDFIMARCLPLPWWQTGSHPRTS